MTVSMRGPTVDGEGSGLAGRLNPQTLMFRHPNFRALRNWGKFGT